MKYDWKFKAHDSKGASWSNYNPEMTKEDQIKFNTDPKYFHYANLNINLFNINLKIHVMSARNMYEFQVAFDEKTIFKSDSYYISPIKAIEAAENKLNETLLELNNKELSNAVQNYISVKNKMEILSINGKALSLDRYNKKCELRELEGETPC